MESPKSKKRPWQEQTKRKKTWSKRTHHNKKFYNSKQWRVTRQAYITHLKNKVWKEALEKIWTIRGATLNLDSFRSAYLLSIDFAPCEQCVKLLAVDIYDKVNPGVELDHIEPLNPDGALDSKGWGDPFNPDNLQLLCKKHHAKKTGRDNAVIKAMKRSIIIIIILLGLSCSRKADYSFTVHPEVVTDTTTVERLPQ